MQPGWWHVDLTPLSVNSHKGKCHIHSVNMPPNQDTGRRITLSRHTHTPGATSRLEYYVPAMMIVCKRLFSRKWSRRQRLSLLIVHDETYLSIWKLSGSSLPASPLRICAVTRGFQTTFCFPVPTKTLSYDSCVTITIITTVLTPVVLAIINII